MGANSFTPIANRSQLSKLVSKEIENAILLKKFLPGDKLPSEAELCINFNVSRTAVREALQSLSARGLIRIEKGRGVFVEHISSKIATDPMYLFLKLKKKGNYSYDIIKARQLIEPQVAGWAARYHDEDDLKQIERNLEELDNQGYDVEMISRIDMDFHLILAKASKNELIPLILDPIHRLMPKIKAEILESVDEARISAIEWHSIIYKYIAERNEKKAYDAMYQHLLNAEEHMEKMMESIHHKKVTETKNTK